jgi:phosphate transport system ATP-binding protein
MSNEQATPTISTTVRSADGGDESRTVSLANPTIIEAQNLSVYYGSDRALDDVTMGIPQQKVTAIIGPSGCGKSTFLRCINRMNDLVDAA